MELPSSELELNCLYRNWNWSRIVFIGIGIGVELPLSELELELNCLLDWVPDSELPLSELELNCKNGIDPSSALVHYAIDHRK